MATSKDTEKRFDTGPTDSNGYVPEEQQGEAKKQKSNGSK